MFKITSKINCVKNTETRFATVDVEVDRVQYFVDCSWNNEFDIIVEKIEDIDNAEYIGNCLYVETKDIEYGDLYIFIEYVCKRYLKNQLTVKA